MDSIFIESKISKTETSKIKTMKKYTLFTVLLLLALFSTCCIINLELIFALVKTTLYLGGTTLFVLLPFLFLKENKKELVSNDTISATPKNRKVSTMKTTLLEKGENESTYMSIYRVNNSP